MRYVSSTIQLKAQYVVCIYILMTLSLQTPDPKDKKQKKRKQKEADDSNHPRKTKKSTKEAAPAGSTESGDKPLSEDSR